MAKKQAQLIGKVRIDNSELRKDVAAAKREADGFSRHLAKMRGGVIPSGGGGLGKTFQGLFSSGSLATLGRAGGVLGTVALAVGSLNKAANQAAAMESLVAGLRATSNGSEDVVTQLEKLRELAKMPGLGFEEAVQGSTRLQAVGISAERSRDILREFGNALASVGGGKEEMSGVILALSQMASKGKVMAQELMQLAERLPQVRRVMKEAFGTAEAKDIEKMGITVEQFINGMTDALAKQERVQAGLKASTEGLAEAWDRFMAAVGKGVGPAAGMGKDIGAGFLGDAATVLERFQNWVFNDVGQSTAEAIGKQIEAAAAKRAEQLDELTEKTNQQAAAEDRWRQAILDRARADQKALTDAREAARKRLEANGGWQNADDPNAEIGVRIAAARTRATAAGDPALLEATAKRLQEKGDFALAEKYVEMLNEARKAHAELLSLTTQQAQELDRLEEAWKGIQAAEAAIKQYRDQVDPFRPVMPGVDVPPVPLDIPQKLEMDDPARLYQNLGDGGREYGLRPTPEEPFVPTVRMSKDGRRRRIGSPDGAAPDRSYFGIDAMRAWEKDPGTYGIPRRQRKKPDESSNSVEVRSAEKGWGADSEVKGLLTQLVKNTEGLNKDKSRPVRATRTSK